jgi:hypothetical protein
MKTAIVLREHNLLGAFSTHARGLEMHLYPRNPAAIGLLKHAYNLRRQLWLLQHLLDDADVVLDLLQATENLAGGREPKCVQRDLQPLCGSANRVNGGRRTPQVDPPDCSQCIRGSGDRG